MLKKDPVPCFRFISFSQKQFLGLHFEMTSVFLEVGLIVGLNDCFIGWHLRIMQSTKQA